eukprot:SAG22_NODE_11860_length_466_cov_0.923706_1_plen_112_part_01
MFWAAVCISSSSQGGGQQVPRVNDQYLEAFGGPSVAMAAEHRVVSAAVHKSREQSRWHGVLVNEEGRPYAYGHDCQNGQLGLGGHYQQPVGGAGGAGGGAGGAGGGGGGGGG